MIFEDGSKQPSDTLFNSVMSLSPEVKVNKHGVCRWHMLQLRRASLRVKCYS